MGLVRSFIGGRLGVPDWLDDVVPEWLAEVVRPKKAPIPWGTMARAVLALWVPLAVAFLTGRRELALLPALGALSWPRESLCSTPARRSSLSLIL